MRELPHAARPVGDGLDDGGDSGDVQSPGDPGEGRNPARAAPETNVLDRLAALQRLAGNAAVVRLLSPPGTAADREAPSADDQDAG